MNKIIFSTTKEKTEFLKRMQEDVEKELKKEIDEYSK